MNKPFSDDTVIKRKPDIISGDVDGEILLMSIHTGNYHSLNATGTRILELVETPRTFKSIIQALTDEYASKAPVIADETARFLEKLLDRDIIEVDENGAE